MSQTEESKKSQYNLRKNPKKTQAAANVESKTVKAAEKTADKTVSSDVKNAVPQSSKSVRSSSSSQKQQRLHKLELRKQQAALDTDLKLDLEKDLIEQQAMMDKIKRDFEVRAIERRREASQKKYALSSAMNEIDVLSEPSCESFEEEDRDVIGAGQETIEEKLERTSNASQLSRRTTDDLSALGFDHNSEMLKQLIKMQPTNIKEFGGEKDDYFEFKASFVRLEKKRVYDDDELLSILLTHVKGEAKRALTGILHCSGQYWKAWDILTDRYGNKTRLTNVKLEAIRKHAAVTPNNLTQLRDLIDSLSAFMETMRCAGRHHELQNSLLIADLLLKLPRGIIHSWNKMVVRGQVEETLPDFKEFLMNEERIWEADPTSSRLATDKNSQSDSKSKYEAKRKPERYTGDRRDRD